MIYVHRIQKDNIDALTVMLPLEVMTDYVMDEGMFAYGMYAGTELVGTVLLREEINEIVMFYLYMSKEWETLAMYLIDNVAYDMYKKGVKSLVYRFTDNQESIASDVLENMGFTIRRNDMAMFKFSIKQLLNAPVLNGVAHNVITLQDVDNIRLRYLCSDIADAGEDIINMPLNVSDYVADCSAVYMEGDVAKGILLLIQDEGAGLRIPFIYSSSTNPMAIVEMMKFMLSKAKRRFDENEECRTYVVEPVLVKIIEKITGLSAIYQQSAILDLNVMQRYIDIYN